MLVAYLSIVCYTPFEPLQCDPSCFCQSLVPLYAFFLIMSMSIVSFPFSIIADYDLRASTNFPMPGMCYLLFHLPFCT